MWVADKIDNKIYAYHAFQSFTSRNLNAEFDTLIAAGNSQPKGIWSDDETLWVANAGQGHRRQGKIFAYNLASKERDSSKDFNTIIAAGNAHPTGIWSDGTTMWVAEWDDDKLYAYNLADKSRDAGEDFDTLIAAGNHEPIGL